MEKENTDFLCTQDVAGGIQVEVISSLVFHFLEINSVLKDPWNPQINFTKYINKFYVTSQSFLFLLLHRYLHKTKTGIECHLIYVFIAMHTANAFLHQYLSVYLISHLKIHCWDLSILYPYKHILFILLLYSCASYGFITIYLSIGIYVLSSITQLKTVLQALRSSNVLGASITVYRGGHHKMMLGILQRFLGFA